MGECGSEGCSQLGEILVEKNAPMYILHPNFYPPPSTPSTGTL